MKQVMISYIFLYYLVKVALELHFFVFLVEDGPKTHWSYKSLSSAKSVLLATDICAFSCYLDDIHVINGAFL